MLRRSKTFANELDVLILAHHGSDCGVTTKKFLDMVKPGVAICSSNYDNQYDHPTQNVRDLLYELGIPIYTTKTGDVTIESIGDHTTNYRVKNLIADSTKLSSHRDLASRKSAYLKMNADTIRARARPGFKGMVRR
jgi:competence protein ComEC